MRKKTIIFCIGLLAACTTSIPLLAQTPITIFKGRVEIEKKEGFSVSHAFAEGDFMVIDVQTDKKKLRQFVVKSTDNKTAVRRSNIEELKGFRYKVPEEGIYTFSFIGMGSGRMTDITIGRIPGEGAPRHFSTGFYSITTNEEEWVDYEVDSLVGELPPEQEKKSFEVFDQYLFETRMIRDESFQLKGNVTDSHTKNYTLKFPDDNLKEGIKPLYWTNTIFSKIGGEGWWNAVEIGAPMVVALAGGGAVGAAGTTAALNYLGPQEGGEPTLYFFTKDEHDIGEMKSRMRTTAGSMWDVAKSKVTGSSMADLDIRGIWQLGNVSNMYQVNGYNIRDNWMFLGNLDPHKAKNVKIEQVGTYYAPSYATMEAYELVVKPKIIQVPRRAKSISSRHFYQTNNANSPLLAY